MYRLRTRKQNRNEGQRKTILVCPVVDDPSSSRKDDEQVKFECIFNVDNMNAFSSSTQKNT